MAATGIYLNFPGNTEEVFEFYKSVFQVEYDGGGVMRFGNLPPQEGAPALSESLKNKIMHVQITLSGGFRLMGADAMPEMGQTVKSGNNFYINLEPKNRVESHRLFDALSSGGKIESPLTEMFWGAYFGTCIDRFGIQWMFNCMSKD